MIIYECPDDIRGILKKTGWVEDYIPAMWSHPEVTKKLGVEVKFVWNEAVKMQMWRDKGAK